MKLHRIYLARSATLLSFSVLLASGPVQAADFGGNCCADLEDRIAELESTVAHKGNRKVSLQVYGHINKAILFWDDGGEDNAYIVDNQNDQSNFGFTGDAAVSNDVTVGYSLLIRLQRNLSGEVSQDDDDTNLPNFLIWESNVFVESKTLGRVTLGQASRVSDGAPENDLSETASAGYAGVQDIGGGMALRRSGDGALIGIGWGDIYSHFNGDTANVIRYDSPSIAGFTFSASWGEDDIWDVGVSYGGDVGTFHIDASIAYTENSDENGAFGTPGEPDFSIVVGSIAVLHQPTGLNALIAAGQQSFDDPVVDADGATRSVSDASFVYTKLGWIATLNSLGHTAFFGEYGYFKDFVSAGADPVLVAELDGGGGAVRITGNKATVWGAGISQEINAANMQVYIGYRYHEADFDLVNAAGNSVATTGLEDFHTVIVGSHIDF